MTCAIRRCASPYPECDSCVNREHDPEQCEDCDDASNYESIDGDEEWATMDDLREMSEGWA